eukprot:TRINITY_DN4501_c0_g1_i1.p1 TRINITY_DN4501_c0_g1~~TRINITY_DN4501_c0_g1_i1.p1  ORF type:complete len:333 (-),score=43.80 TRINITY_DN4501_c0_g1_i1:115-1113(-)
MDSSPRTSPVLIKYGLDRQVLLWSEFRNIFDGILDELVTFYRKDKLYMALDRLNQIEKNLQFHLQNVWGHDADLLVQMTSKLYAGECGTIVKSLRTECAQVDHLLEELRNEEGWTLVRESDGVKTFYRHEESTPTYSIKMEGIIDSPLFNVLALAYEDDLYKNFIPMVKESRRLHFVSGYRKVVYMRTELPWPVWSRDVCLYGYGVDMLERDAVAISIRSVKENEFANIPPVPHKHIRADCNMAGLLAQPISHNRTKVIMLANADPKLAYLPYSLLNMVTKQLAHLMFSLYRKQSAKMEGTIYEQRIKENSQIYGEIKERLDQYFKERHPPK